MLYERQKFVINVILEMAFCAFFNECVFFFGSYVLFIRLVSKFFFSKNNFKISSDDSIYIFKNNFITVFLFFYF